LLKDMLSGEVESRTGLPYRGKGLPSMNQDLIRGGIRNLIIISNDVKAEVEKQNFEVLPRPFRGTLIYWEVPA